MICSCQTEFDAVLCDLPQEWRKAVVDALCYTFHNSGWDCSGITQTLTSLSPFTIDGTTLSVSYKNENGTIQTRSVDISEALEQAIEDVEPDCLMSEEDWALLSHPEKVEAIIAAYCECCTTTTTTTTSTSTTTTSSSTTTTTTSPFDYFIADEFNCVDGVCQQVDTGIVVQVPNGFTPTPGFYYPGISVPTDLYSLIVPTILIDNTTPINTGAGNVSCTSFCPTTTTTTTTSTSTTTTSTSTTTTTTCCPSTDVVMSSCTCKEYVVTNTDGSDPHDFSYTDCEMVFTEETLDPSEEVIICACEDAGFSGDGEVDIIEVGLCTDNTTSTTTTSSSTTTTSTEEPTTTTSSTTTTTTNPELNFIVDVDEDVSGAAILSVTPPIYLIIDGTIPVNEGETASGNHVGFTAALEVEVDWVGPSSLALTLYRDAVPLECIPISTDGTYTFASFTFTSGQVCLIQLTEGVCF